MEEKEFNVPSVGTKVKINVSMDPVNDVHLNEMDFRCEFFCTRMRVQRFRKRDLNEVDADNFLAEVDTRKIGAGMVYMRITVEVPDADCRGGFRTEVATVPTGVIIER